MKTLGSRQRIVPVVIIVSPGDDLAHSIRTCTSVPELDALSRGTLSSPINVLQCAKIDSS